MEETFINKFQESALLFRNKVFIYEAESDTEYTYGQFYKDVLNVSFFLQTQFITKSVIVLAAKNSYLFSVHIMAVIYSRKTLLLLNPEESSYSLKKILNQINEEFVILADENFIHQELSSESLRVHPETDEDYATEKNPQQSLILIPTSSTTGDSKIVVQSQKAIIENVMALINHHHLDSSSSIATPLPLFHVNALHFSFFCTMFSGGTLSLFKQFDLKKTFKTIESRNISILSVIPSILNSVVRNFDQVSNINISSLKYFVSAAAPLSISTVKNIHALMGKKIIQGYGLSESVNFTCTIPSDVSDETYLEIAANGKYPSVGITLEKNEIRIIKGDSSICLESEEGEILIKSPSLMSGYLNNSTDYLHEGYFKTGDLGYFKKINGENYYFISGRLKETAKINGHSVSLREVDEVLSFYISTAHDFISTSFENSFSGESLALIFKVEASDVTDNLLNLITLDLETTDPLHRPKIILFTTQPIRTPSGKAKRWNFKKYFLEYLEHRFMKNIISISTN